MHIKGHEYFIPPDDENVKIWRYMDLTKLLYTLEKSVLFFSRADQFKDPFEGAISTESIKQTKVFYATNNVPEVNIEQLFQVYREAPGYTYINCWHMNSFESAAMWDSYLKSNEGIAIQSTFKRLSDSIIDSRNVYIGKVFYLNYDRDVIPMNNMFAPFLCKRSSFSHENELRCVIQKFQHLGTSNDTYGMDIQVDLNALIENIYVSPTAPSWIVDLVKDIVKRYDIDLSVIKSRLYDKPMSIT